jgi:hypothetical protein
MTLRTILLAAAVASGLFTVVRSPVALAAEAPVTRTITIAVPDMH